MSQRKKSRVTLQDIADALGISRGTVDRAVHSRGRISEKTRNEILDKAAAMGYIDDKISRFTTLKKKAQILALFPVSSSFFYEKIKTGLRSAVAEQNNPLIELKMIDYNPEDSSGFLHILEKYTQTDELKAVLLVPTGHFSPSLKLPGVSDIPYITINTDLPESGRLCFIGQDLYQSGRIGAELIHKVSSKGQLLILSGYKGLWAHDERVRGVEALLNEIACERKWQIRYCDDDMDNAQEIVASVCSADKDISGVLSLTANSTLGALRALKSLGHKSLLSLVGYDFNQELSTALDEGRCDALIGQNPELQGSSAFKLLYKVLFNDFKLTKEFYVTPTELFLRELRPGDKINADFFI